MAHDQDVWSRAVPLLVKIVLFGIFDFDAHLTDIPNEVCRHVVAFIDPWIMEFGRPNKMKYAPCRIMRIMHVNTPQFTWYLRAVHFKQRGRCHEQQTASRRIQDCNG